MKKFFKIFFVVIVLIGGALTRSPEKIVIPTPDMPAEKSEEVVRQEFKYRSVELVNVERERKGLPALKRNALLDKSAQMKADDMAERHYWAHEGPNGELPWGFFDKVGYEYSFAGENLARDYY